MWSLLARHARSNGRNRFPTLEIHQADLSDAAAIRSACSDVDAVFHVAAKAGVWGPRADYERSNVLGTQNVLDAMRAHGVRKLVYTSTRSVVHAGTSLEAIDEGAPYATRFSAFYPETKARAEQAVLAANTASLRTVALRPHLIWGPGDHHLLPRLIERARAQTCAGACWKAHRGRYLHRQLRRRACLSVGSDFTRRCLWKALFCGAG